MLYYIDVFGYPVFMFQVCIAVGILCAFAVFFILSKKRNLDIEIKETILMFLPFCLIVGFLGAALFDKIAHWGEKPWYQPQGLTFYGGIIGGAGFFVFLYYFFVPRVYRNFFEHANIIVCAIPIAHCFGRIGCFLAGCCFGQPTDSIFGVVFPIHSPASDMYGYGTKVIPTQLFEAGGLLLISCFILTLKKYNISFYCLSYAILRFALEFLRGDNRGFFSPILSPSQIMCIILFNAGLLLLYCETRASKLVRVNPDWIC